MKKKCGKKFFVLAMAGFFLCTAFSSTVLAKSEAYFNKPVDKRFAWLNNDAHGEADFQNEIIKLINSAEKSVDICTMSFGGVNDISDALAAAAGKGINVRIISDGGKRFQEGFQRTLRGSVQIADNNLPALVCRINFQKKGSKVPGGFLPDYGDKYANRGNGYTYGWTTAVSENDFKKTASSEYNSSLLGDVYTVQNTTSTQWQIKLPDGYYYVLVNVGQDGYSCLNYIKVQGKNVFTYKSNGKLLYSEYKKTKPSEFSCSTVDGGETNGVANSQRVKTENGKLTVTVGGNKVSDIKYTALNFIEIYRASPKEKYGDDGTNKKYVQKRQLQHGKYILIDGGTQNAKLWTGSGNLTAAMTSLSEDAVLTDEKEICNAFYEQFNQMWGGKQFVPNPDKAVFGKFKTAMSMMTYSVSNSFFSPVQDFSWQVHFSPSKLPKLNLYSDLSKFISGTKYNFIMLMEQWTDGKDINDTLRGSTYLMEQDLTNYLKTGKYFYGLFGNSDKKDSVFNYFKDYENANIKQVETTEDYGIHNKFVLSDAYRDTRYTKRGSLLFGSMNWSQSGMHFNDEQTIIVRDPALANQYLQRAMAALDKEKIMPSSKADIVLVLDRSYSMNLKCSGKDITKLDAMKTAANLFVDLIACDGKHRISVVRFGTDVEKNKFDDTAVLKSLTPEYAETIKKEINSISSTLSEDISSWTCYGSALKAALERFDDNSNNSRKFIVFFTDGMENKAPMASTVYPDLVKSNVEIHSVAFGNFSPFGTESSTSVLSEMATASAGTFAQIDTDDMRLKKRFAEIAADVMDSSVILDPEYELTKKEPKVNFEIPEAVDSFQVLLLNDSVFPAPEMNLSEKGTSKRRHVAIEKQQYQSSDYKISNFKTDLSNIKDKLPKMECKIKQKVPKRFKGKMNLMILAKAPTTIKAETVVGTPGQKDIILLCRMLQNNKPLKDAEITAEWTTPVSSQETKTVTIKLYDDGQHGDGESGDGVYGAALTLDEAGNHAFHITAVSSQDERLDAVKEKIKSKKKLSLFVPKVRREVTVYYTVNK